MPEQGRDLLARGQFPDPDRVDQAVADIPDAGDAVVTRTTATSRPSGENAVNSRASGPGPAGAPRCRSRYPRC